MLKLLENEPNDATLLVNKMAGLSTSLHIAYRRFQDREISEDSLRTEILRILNGNYPESLVDPIIQELELRCYLEDQVVLLFSSYQYKTFHYVLGRDNRVSITETIRFFFQSQLEKQKPADSGICAIYGLTEFISERYDIFEKGYFSDRHRTECIIAMFYLSAIHGHLDFLREVWARAESLKIEKEVLSYNNFSAIAAGRASTNSQVIDFIMSCADKVNLTSEIPKFSDGDMFQYYAHANNHTMLLTCWENDRTSEEKLSLLTRKNCDIYDNLTGENQEKTRGMLLGFLISLKESGVIIPNNIWITYFKISAKNACLLSVKTIWQALEDDELKESLLNEVLIEASLDQHVPVIKFIIEQAEFLIKHTHKNPVQHSMLEVIEVAIQISPSSRLCQLYKHSTLLNDLHNPTL